MSTIPDGRPEDGFEEFEFLGFGDALADCVINEEWGASVVEDELVIKRFDITPESVSSTTVESFTLSSEPVTYDLTGWQGDGTFGCLLTWFDTNRRVHAVRIRATIGSDGSVVGWTRRISMAPEPEGTAGWPHHVWGAYDPVRGHAVCALGFTDSNVRYEGQTSAAYRWYVSESDWRVAIVGDGGYGDLDLIHASEDNPNVHPTGVIRYDRNEWVVTVVDVGNSLPAYRAQDAIEDGCVTHLVHAVGRGLDRTLVEGYIGRGFIEHKEEVEDGEIVEVIEGYLPHATHGADGISSVGLLRYPDLTLVANADGDPHEIARIEGAGNWRPVGLFAERFQEPEVIDPLFFDPVGFTFQDYLVSLLYGWTGIPGGSVIQDRVMVAISVPDQPAYAPNPRSHPAYLVMVDLLAVVGTDEDGDVIGPANVGEPVRLNFGDALRVASHPSGVSWGVVGRWDEASDVDAEVESGTGGGFSLVDRSDYWQLAEGAVL